MEKAKRFGVELLYTVKKQDENAAYYDLGWDNSNDHKDCMFLVPFEDGDDKYYKIRKLRSGELEISGKPILFQYDPSDGVKMSDVQKEIDEFKKEHNNGVSDDPVKYVWTNYKGEITKTELY